MKPFSLVIISLFIAIAATARTGTGKGAPDRVVRKLEKSLLAKTSHAEKIGSTYSGYLERHRFKTFDVTLDAKQCYTFAAAGGPGVADLSLALTVGKKEVASDRISGKQPIMRWCAADTGKARVRVSMYDGEGAFVMLMLREKAGKAQSAKVGGDGGDFVAMRLRQLHAQFAKGKAVHSRLFQGNLANGTTFVAPVKLKSGHCYVILGAGSPTVRNLDISVTDDGGSPIASDKSANSFPVIDSGLCPKKNGAYSIRVTMTDGSGPFGVQVFSD